MGHENVYCDFDEYVVTFEKELEQEIEDISPDSLVLLTDRGWAVFNF